MKMPLFALRLVTLTLLVCTLGGCVAAIGNREPARSSATLGQQLMDLQKAREAGAITEAEYATQRARFLAEK